VAKKTGSLFALSTAVGAHCAGADTQSTLILKEFGRALGVAFQMVDDILDVTASEDLLGKPSGTDLRQRTPSLVNILWLTSGAEEAVEYFSAPSVSEESLAHALTALRQSAVIDAAREVARECADKARAALLSLPPESVHSGTQQDLLTLLEFTLRRCL
jgi:geranylgeranyl pyrophosphate synthase